MHRTLSRLACTLHIALMSAGLAALLDDVAVLILLDLEPLWILIGLAVLAVGAAVHVVGRRQLAGSAA